MKYLHWGHYIVINKSIVQNNGFYIPNFYDAFGGVCGAACGTIFPYFCVASASFVDPLDVSHCLSLLKSCVNALCVACVPVFGFAYVVLILTGDFLVASDG